MIWKNTFLDMTKFYIRQAGFFLSRVGPDSDFPRLTGNPDFFYRISVFTTIRPEKKKQQKTRDKTLIKLIINV